MKCDSYSCKGESHIASGKPCQDMSLHYCDDKSGVYIAIVCDGHGGDRYFRSDFGAQSLAEITKDSILQFVECIESFNKKNNVPVFSNCPFTQVPVLRDRDGSHELYSEENTRLQQLFASIITRWNEKIEEDAANRQLTEWELANVKQEYLNAFNQHVNIEKNYGCTLMAFVQTRKFWIAFHLGDGKFIMFDKSDDCYEPVLWDDKCFLNRTTSICDSSPIDEFRYSYCGNGSHPVAVFLGSDGIDDSYGDGDRLHNFYLNILRCIVSEGSESVHQSLIDDLPVISRIGSQDDMSIAFVYDEDNLNTHVNKLTSKQLGEIDIAIGGIRDKLKAKKRTIDELAGDYESKRANLSSGDLTSSSYKQCEKLRINLKYADSEYNTIRDEGRSLIKQAHSLQTYLGMEAKDYDLENELPLYNNRITSFVDGSYGKECDNQKTNNDTTICCEQENFDKDENLEHKVVDETLPHNEVNVIAVESSIDDSAEKNDEGTCYPNASSPSNGITQVIKEKVSELTTTIVHKVENAIDTARDGNKTQ